MGRLDLPELLVILAIVILIFGVGRISKVAGELGRGIRAFKQGLSGEGEEKTDASDSEKQQPSA